MSEVGKRGTRGVFNSWLTNKKGMTYSKYTQLPTDKKLAIQEEYGTKGKGKTNESGQSDPARKGETTAV